MLIKSIFNSRGSVNTDRLMYLLFNYFPSLSAHRLIELSKGRAGSTVSIFIIWKTFFLREKQNYKNE